MDEMDTNFFASKISGILWRLKELPLRHLNGRNGEALSGSGQHSGTCFKGSAILNGINIFPSCPLEFAKYSPSKTP